MSKFGSKIVLALAATAILVIIMLLVSKKVFGPPESQKPEIKTKTTSPTSNLNERPQIVSTKPDLLSGETIISATETIELIFNRPLENAPELKLRLEPKTDYQVELSFDRKTAKIMPIKPFELGTAYTLTIQQDSKFDGGGRLDKELVFHFRTVRYRGI